MRFKYITQLKKLVGKDLEFQTQINGLMKLEEDQLKAKRVFSLYNRPNKKVSEFELREAFSFIENQTKTLKFESDNLEDIVDQFVFYEEKYRLEKDALLLEYKSLMSKIKGTFFMSNEDRNELRERFLLLNQKCFEMRNLCLFNLATFSLFIYNYESDAVMISDIEKYLNSKNIHLKKVPTYENTIHYELEYDLFGFFFGK